MKKTLIAAFSLFVLTAGSSMAQRVYQRPFDNRPPAYGNQGYPNDPNDEFRDELKIERLDALVGLSRRQEKQLHRIEDNYDHLFATSRFTPQGLRQARARKRDEMLSVLNRSQRERLVAAQQNQRPGRPGGFYGRR